MRSFKIILYTCLILVLASCSNSQTLRGVFKQQTPHERYAASIKSAKLDETALGKKWLTAADNALQDSITITLPFKETGYFASDDPRALSYRFDAKRGEKIEVTLEVKSRGALQVFVDLFEVPVRARTAPVAFADTAAMQLQYDVAEDLQHLLRLQPELLQSGQYTLTIQAKPTLAFPVQGKTSQHIASVWGDARDAGARNHEGIDIFAKRGTPALAATAGTISRVGTNGLGGKVVWLSDAKMNQRLYYAHLDAQLVTEGQQVQAGDTIGLIGNTGNARGINPHLHFGIYRSGQGAVNPYNYVHQSTKKIPAVKIESSRIGNWVRVDATKANVRLQPSAKGSVIYTLNRHTPLLVTGGTSDWYRVKLPDGAEGYIAESIVAPVTKQIRSLKLAKETQLLDEAHPQAAAKANIQKGSSVAVLGTFDAFSYVQNPEGETGWIYTSEATTAE